jgi:hypothetical protein
MVLVVAAACVVPLVAQQRPDDTRAQQAAAQAGVNASDITLDQAHAALEAAAK